MPGCVRSRVAVKQQHRRPRAAVPYAKRHAARVDPFQLEAVEEGHGRTHARTATVATVPVSPRIVLAPLAGGPATPELAAAVSNAGGLGFVAAGDLGAGELARRVRPGRAPTRRPR